MKKITRFVAIFTLLLLISHTAQADILTPLVDSYEQASRGWFTSLQGYAKRLFWLLATIDFVWAASLLCFKNDMSELTAELIKKIMAIGFFYALLVYADTWIPSIIESFKMAGARAGGLEDVLSPSKVVDMGINLSTLLLSNIEKMSLFDSFSAILVSGLSALAILVCFVLTAVQLTIALIESFIVVGAGVIFLGFGGSRWTTDFTQKYISYAVSAGVKLFIIQLILSIALSQAAGWENLIAASQGNIELSAIFYTFAGALMLLCLTSHIPVIAASALSGSPNLDGGSMMSTAAGVAGGALVGARLASGAAGAAASAGQSSIQTAVGAGHAMSAGVQLAKEGGATGAKAMVAGLGNAAKAIGAQSASSVKGAVSQTLSPNANSVVNKATEQLAVKKAALADDKQRRRY